MSMRRSTEADRAPAAWRASSRCCWPRALGAAGAAPTSRRSRAARRRGAGSRQPADAALPGLLRVAQPAPVRHASWRQRVPQPRSRLRQAPPVPLRRARLADFDRAVGFMRSGNATEAELEFKQMALAYPQLAAPYVNLGILYRKAGPASISRRRRSRGRANATARARSPGTSLGATQRLRGEFPDAAASYEHAIAADRSFAPAYRNLGVVSTSISGDPERALTALERYKELTGEDRPVSSWIAELRQRTGKAPVKPAPRPAAANPAANATTRRADSEHRRRLRSPRQGRGAPMHPRAESELLEKRAVGALAFCAHVSAQPRALGAAGHNRLRGASATPPASNARRHRTQLRHRDDDAAPAGSGAGCRYIGAAPCARAASPSPSAGAPSESSGAAATSAPDCESRDRSDQKRDSVTIGARKPAATQDGRRCSAPAGIAATARLRTGSSSIRRRSQVTASCRRCYTSCPGSARTSAIWSASRSNSLLDEVLDAGRS